MKRILSIFLITGLTACVSSETVTRVSRGSAEGITASRGENVEVWKHGISVILKVHNHWSMFGKHARGKYRRMTTSNEQFQTYTQTQMREASIGHFLVEIIISPGENEVRIEPDKIRLVLFGKSLKPAYYLGPGYPLERKRIHQTGKTKGRDAWIGAGRKILCHTRYDYLRYSSSFLKRQYNIDINKPFKVRPGQTRCIGLVFGIHPPRPDIPFQIKMNGVRVNGVRVKLPVVSYRLHP